MPGCIMTVLYALYLISKGERGSDFIHWAMPSFFPFLEASASLLSCFPDFLFNFLVVFLSLFLFYLVDQINAQCFNSEDTLFLFKQLTDFPFMATPSMHSHDSHVFPVFLFLFLLLFIFNHGIFISLTSQVILAYMDSERSRVTIIKCYDVSQTMK